jgi:hypothetical protein
MFYYVYRIQCLVDGSAYFGIKQTNAIDWGEGGFWQLGIRPSTKKFEQKVRQVGMKPWRTTIYICTTEQTVAQRELDKLLAATKGHPLSLNYDEEAHIEAVKKNLEKALPAAIEANTGDPRTKEEKKKISKGVKKHMEKLRAKNEAEGKPDAPLTAGPAGHRWIHNPTTKEEMMIFVDEDLLTGFEEGRLPKE